MRIHVTGASGSGTTTLGRALAAELGCPHLDSDDYYWLPTDPPYQRKREVGERNAMLLDALKSAPTCVESGSLVSWGEEIWALFDRVVFLYVPAEVRLARLRERELRELGSVDPEFMEWAESYDRDDFTGRSRRIHEEWLAKLRCPILRLEGDLAEEERLARVRAWL